MLPQVVVRRQKKLPEKARVTTVLFDDQYQMLHDGNDLMQAGVPAGPAVSAWKWS